MSIDFEHALQPSHSPSSIILSSAPPYGHVAGSAIYYGEGSGVFTLSKLGQLIFPTTTTAGLTSQAQVQTYFPENRNLGELIGTYTSPGHR